MPGESEVIDVVIDSEGLGEGMYFDVISIETNDYDNNLINIPITLEVTDACGQWELGDVNQDNNIDLLDVVQSVNLILSDGYNQLADMDNNGIINILDIVQLIDLIL